MSIDKPFISVVIPSRNRPQLLRKAVESVVAQSFGSVEVVLVNDGYDEQYLEEFNAIAEDHDNYVSVVNLVHYPRGHGPSYAIDSGVMHSRGQFCTFLDDDDYWTDKEHLRKVHDALSSHPEADLYYTNQEAVEVGKDNGEVLWLGPLAVLCEKAGIKRQQGVYRVDVDLLMQCNGFAHLNTSVIRRELFDEIQGMDEDIRWEGDHDFYLRSIDRARVILFNPDVVSRHNIPDKAKSVNVTTSTSHYQRLNYQLYVFNKAVLTAKHTAIVNKARLHKAYTLRKIATSLYAEKRFGDADYYCREALFMTWSVSWPFFCLRVWLARLFGK